MEVSQTSEGYALPCGQQLETLWENLETGRSALPGSHEESCPHCLTALSGLTALRDATARLAAAPVLVPPRLTSRIMAAVRADGRRTRMLPLPATDLEAGGQAQISQQAVAVVLRFAADSIPGIRARRCTIRPVTPDEAPDGEPGWDAVELTLAIGYRSGAGMDSLTAVRHAVLAAAETQIGLRIVRCDLVVEDVWSGDE
jgi:hypothetical protein